MSHWTDDIEKILIKLRDNSILRSKYHKKSYMQLYSLLKLFRIPIIIFSSLLSVFSMSTFELQKYICCTMSLFISIISSIEMFLQIQKRMEIDLYNAKTFSALSENINKILNLQKENRNIDGLKYLDDVMNNYNSLVDLSIIDDTNLHDKIFNEYIIEESNINKYLLQENINKDVDNTMLVLSSYIDQSNIEPLYNITNDFKNSYIKKPTIYFRNMSKNIENINENIKDIKKINDIEDQKNY